MKSPCKDCTNRAVGCHGICAEYKSYKEYNDNRNNSMKVDKELDGFLVQQVIRRHKNPIRGKRI